MQLAIADKKQKQFGICNLDTDNLSAVIGRLYPYRGEYDPDLIYSSSVMHVGKHTSSHDFNTPGVRAIKMSTLNLNE